MIDFHLSPFVSSHYESTIQTHKTVLSHLPMPSAAAALWCRPRYRI